jgi:hypothetical protein
MLHIILVWLTVAAFAGAGVFNAIGTRGTQEDFTRWGYPGWWCRVTGGLEVVTAALLLVPAGRPAGIILGFVIIAVALATVLRHREYPHTAPLCLFAALLALVAATS